MHLTVWPPPQLQSHSFPLCSKDSSLPPQGLYTGYSFSHGHCSPHPLTSSLSYNLGLSSHVSHLLRDAFLAHSPTPVDNPLPQPGIYIFRVYILRALPTALNYLVYLSVSCFSLCLCPLKCDLLLPAVSLGWTQGLSCRRCSVTTLARGQWHRTAPRRRGQAGGRPRWEHHQGRLAIPVSQRVWGL